MNLLQTPICPIDARAGPRQSPSMSATAATPPPATKRAWKLQEFVAHGAAVNCLALGHKSGRVLVTGKGGYYNGLYSLEGTGPGAFYLHLGEDLPPGRMFLLYRSLSGPSWIIGYGSSPEDEGAGAYYRAEGPGEEGGPGAPAAADKKKMHSAYQKNPLGRAG